VSSGRFGGGGWRAVDPADAALRYRGAISLQHKGIGIAPWRIPHEEAKLYLPTGGVGRGAMPAGVRVALRTDSSRIGCAYRASPPPPLPAPGETARLDVCCDGSLFATIELDTGESTAEFVVDGLPPGEHLIELWLPFFSQFVLDGLFLDGGASLHPDARERRSWAHFGSSISQGRGAASPSRAWYALVAEAANLDVQLSAMGGGCQIQPMFAGLIRDSPAAMITLCVGVNPHHFSSLNQETFQPNLIGFVRVIRERKPDTPIAVISSIHAPKRERLVNKVEMTLADYREETEAAVRHLVGSGDDRLVYVDGLSLFGPDDAHLLLERPEADPVHLDPAGHELLARRFGRLLRSLEAGKTEPEPVAQPANALP
jgi:lysophospholipase L1-like esterase